MKLIVHELVSSLYWAVESPLDPRVIRGIRPHLLRYGAPTGSLYMEIRKASDETLYATSETIAVSSIPVGTYWHGFIRFYTNFILPASTNLKVYLKSSGGYAFAETAYIGWCIEWDSLRKYDMSSDYFVTEDAPFDCELWGYKNVTKGTYP